MGYSVALDDSYFRPTEKQLLTEYLKAVNELTINEENRLKKKVTELEKKQDEINQLRYEHGQLKLQYDMAVYRSSMNSNLDEDVELEVFKGR